ncbi:MAG: type II toxin-antitoxin system HigB family toxin [Chitinophagaceae bacterium]|nr:type II toxin-antitoxin system HigB family toxin [Chitinophagaceae bacterium]
MLIINQKLLSDFCKKHADSRKSIATWLKFTREAVWKKKQDVLTTFPNAKMLENSRARFEIVHNRYRLIVKVDYTDGRVVIRFIGTHSEYDNIDPTII